MVSRPGQTTVKAFHPDLTAEKVVRPGPTGEAKVVHPVGETAGDPVDALEGGKAHLGAGVSCVAGALRGHSMATL